MLRQMLWITNISLPTDLGIQQKLLCCLFRMPIQNDVCLALSKGEAAAVVLFDLSANFYTIDHNNCLIGYHHGLVHVGQLSHGSGCILLIAFNALQSVLFCQMHESSYKAYHRVRFPDPYFSHSIPLPFSMSLPTTPTFGFIFMLMIPNSMYT